MAAGDGRRDRVAEVLDALISDYAFMYPVRKDQPSPEQAHFTGLLVGVRLAQLIAFEPKASVDEPDLVHGLIQRSGEEIVQRVADSRTELIARGETGWNVWCDQAGCGSVLKLGPRKIEEAKRAAAEAGWRLGPWLAEKDREWIWCPAHTANADRKDLASRS